MAVKITAHCHYCTRAFPVTQAETPLGELAIADTDRSGLLCCPNCLCSCCGLGHFTADERSTCEFTDSLASPVDIELDDEDEEEDEDDDYDYERYYGDPDAAYDLAVERELCDF